MAASPHVPFFDPESPVFRAHEGGKLGVHATKPLEGREDLALLYTPGVAEVSLAIAADPALSMRYTARRNTVAVISDGTAVLGLGDIGPLGAMPVMEGKAVLFKHFAGIDAVPVVMETGTVEELVEAIARIAPSYGGINLEDISAPRCFEIERRLRERLDIPVFHDDQHGTAIVALAALVNAVRVVDKSLADVTVVVSGAGAAGAKHVLVWDREGILSPDDASLSPAKKALAELTNPEGITGDLHDALRDADVFIGVSAPGVLPAPWIADMAPSPIVFALANPDPETDVDAAQHFAAVLATGRSDYPNQINNVLAFPGVFRGLLDARAREVTTAMLLSAAAALAACVSDEQLNATYIVPSVFDPAVPTSVAAAVREAAGVPTT
ncbi:MAG TPA: NADP-dependent malic enzyme [Candidatus Nanopelagicales bacterium]|nr:NADP-dependent malic enzyme [Candidatus Nanopelagicales bacterium]